MTLRARCHVAAVLWAAAAVLAAQQPTQPPAAPPVATPQGGDADLRERAATAENAGRNSEAAELWLELARRDPTRAEWVLAAGRCLGMAGRFNDAIEFLTAQRRAFPGMLEIPALLARTHLLRVERDSGLLNPDLEYADAAAIAEEVLRSEPDHEDARLILAQARYGQGDLEAAIAQANEAARRFPNRAGAHVLVGRIAYDQYAATRRLLDSPEIAKESLYGSLDSARRQAVAEFTRAAELDPDRAFARIMLGQIAALEKDNAAALREWGTALAIDPAARVDHGWIAARTKTDERREFYRAAGARYAARKDADTAKAATLTFYEAKALYDQGDWEAARALFRRCREQNAAFVNAEYYGAMASWQLHDEDAAEQLAASYAAASAPGFADVLRELPPQTRAEVAGIVEYLGHRAFKAGRKDRSRDLNHVIACLLDSADAWNNYAFLCRETSRFDDAYAGYQHAIEKEPDSPQLWNDAAVILQFHQPSPENFARARSMYERALELADHVLGNAASSDIAKERARNARLDAQRNLDELPKPK